MPESNQVVDDVLNKTELEQYLQGGKTYKDIAKLKKLTVGAVRYRMKKYGLAADTVRKAKEPIGISIARTELQQKGCDEKFIDRYLEEYYGWN